MAGLDPASPRRRGRFLLGAAAVAVLAIAVRLYGIGSVPLWTDELFTRAYPGMGLHYLWGEGFRAEPTAPLYYTLIAAVERIGGADPWALRLPSVLGSLLGVALAYRLARELTGRPGVALLAALLLALLPINVFYAGEARAYALQGAALAGALLGTAQVLRGGSPILFAACATLAMWLHPTSAAALIGMDAAVLLGALGRAPLLPWAAFGRFVLANGAVALLCVPLLPGLLFPPGGGAATSWIPPLSRPALEDLLGQTLLGPAIGTASQRAAEIGVLVLLLLGLVPPWRPGRRTLLVLLVAPGIFLLLLIGISASKPVLLTRTLAWLGVPLAVALADIARRRPPVLGPVLVLIAAGALALQLDRLPGLREDWRALFAAIGPLAPPTLLVLAPHTPPGAVALYAEGGAEPVRLDDGGPPVPETTVIPHLFGTPTIDRPAMAAAIAAGRPVWLLYRRPEYDWVQREIGSLPSPRQEIKIEDGRNPALRALRW